MPPYSMVDIIFEPSLQHHLRFHETYSMTETVTVTQIQSFRMTEAVKTSSSSGGGSSSGRAADV